MKTNPLCGACAKRSRAQWTSRSLDSSVIETKIASVAGARSDAGWRRSKLVRRGVRRLSSGVPPGRRDDSAWRRAVANGEALRLYSRSGRSYLRVDTPICIHNWIYGREFVEFTRGLGARLLRDIQKGIGAGRFKTDDALMAFLVLSGTVLAALSVDAQYGKGGEAALRAELRRTLKLSRTFRNGWRHRCCAFSECRSGSKAHRAPAIGRAATWRAS